MKTKIDTVAAIALKGQNFRHETAALTCIYGDNKSGKTSVAEAIRIGILGHLPSLGKKAGATMQLAPDSASQMEVELAFSDATRIRRTFSRTKTGASSKDAGSVPELNPAQLDFRQFIAAKPTERHAILNSLMGKIDLQKFADEMNTEIAKLGIRDSVSLRLDPQAENPIDQLLADLGELSKALKQTVDQHRKTLATLITEDNVPSIDTTSIGKAQEEIAKGNQALGAATAKLDQINEAIQRAPEEPTDKEATPEEIEQLVKKLAEATAELNAIQKSRMEKHTADQERARLGNLLNKHLQIATVSDGKEPTKTEEEIAEAKAKYQSLEQKHRNELTELKIDIGKNEAEAKRIQSQIESLEKTGCCPTCGTEGQVLEIALEALREKKTVAEKMVAEIAERKQKCEAEIEACQDQLVELQQDAIRHGSKQAQDEADRIKAELEKLDQSTYSATAEKEAEETVRGIDRAIKDASKTKAEWDTYRNARIPTDQEAKEASESVERIRTKLEALKSELETLKEQQARHEQWKSDQQRIATLRKEADDNEETKGKIETLKNWTKDRQREATAEAMKPLLGIAGIFLEGLVEGQLATREHLIGVERNGSFIPLEVLSGLEMTVLASACQAALAQQGSLPILIVDEMGIMTPKNRATFGENCQRAIEAGIVSQVFLLDQTPDHHTAETMAFIQVA